MVKRILVVVPDGADDLEVAPFVEIPGWTKVIEDIERVDVKIAGWDEKVHMFHGLTIVPDLMIGEVRIDDYDAICIPGGWGGTKYFEQAHSPQFLDLLKAAHARGKLIATACNGILAVGEAGLLKGRKATAYTGESCEYCVEIRKRIEGYGAHWREESLVTDKNVISTIGPAVGAEDALRLMEKLIGAKAVRRIVSMMMYDTVKPGELRYTFPKSKKRIS